MSIRAGRDYRLIYTLVISPFLLRLRMSRFKLIAGKKAFKNFNINEAIQKMKEWARLNAHKSVYASNCFSYLKAVPEVIEDYGTEGLKVQLIYAIANVGGWRGSEARESKKVIREWIKSKE